MSMSENRNLVNPLNMLWFKICSIKNIILMKQLQCSLKFFQPEIFVKLKRTLYMVFSTVHNIIFPLLSTPYYFSCGYCIICVVLVRSVHNYCINYAIMMHSYHHGIVGQGVISTSYRI